MEMIVSELLTRSYAICFLVPAVFLARLVCRRAPKRFVCLLWAVVAVRLVFPLSIESGFSLIPDEKQTATNVQSVFVPSTKEQTANTAAQTPKQTKHVAAKTKAAKAAAASETVRVTREDVWLLGLALLLLYTAASLLWLREKLQAAVHVRDNIWESDGIGTPFVLGLVKPRIYLPFGLSEQARPYVLSHENAHIARKDHWTKAAAWLLVCVYWFHPLVWLSYVLFSRDLEMACDERVAAVLSADERKTYAKALLDCGTAKKQYTFSPVGFGASNIRKRVQNLKRYRKPVAAAGAATLALVALVAVCFLTNAKASPIREMISYELPAGLTESAYDADVAKIAGGVGGCLWKPDAYEYGDDPNWVCAGRIFQYENDTVLTWEKRTISYVEPGWGVYQESDRETVSSLSFPAYLLRATCNPSEEFGVDLPEFEGIDNSYWFLFFARRGDTYGYAIVLNAKDYSKDDVLAVGETVQFLNPEPELTMDTLFELEEEKAWARCNFNVYANGEQEDLDDYNYLLQFPLKNGEEELTLLAYMKLENDKPDMIFLKKNNSDDAIPLYGTQGEKTPIQEFLETDYDLHREISYTLPDGLEEQDYKASDGLDMEQPAGGCIWGPFPYQWENSTADAWVASGSVSRYGIEDVTFSGDTITGVTTGWNHTTEEEFGSVDGLAAPAYLMKVNHDLYNAAEMEIYEIPEEYASSDYWVLFMARPGDAYGYAFALDVQTFDREDILELGKSVTFASK